MENGSGVPRQQHKRVVDEKRNNREGLFFHSDDQTNEKHAIFLLSIHQKCQPSCPRVALDVKEVEKQNKVYLKGSYHYYRSRSSYTVQSRCQDHTSSSKLLHSST